MHYRKIKFLCLALSLNLFGCGNLTEQEMKIDTSKVYVEKDDILLSTNSIDSVKIYNSGEKYYYSKLTSEENRLFYMEIKEALVGKRDSIILKTEDTDRVKKLFRMVLYDNASIFYVDSYKYKIKNNGFIELFPKYRMNASEMVEAEQLIQNYINDVKSRINDSMSDFDKEKIIYDYLVLNTDYNYDSEYGQSIYSVVNGKSVCMGMAKMFQLLCEEVGLPCIIVTGLNENGIGHAWNCVLIDGRYYMVDVTNDEYVPGELNYYFFNVTRDFILRNYSINNMVEVPECNFLYNEYFYKNGLYFEDVNIPLLSYKIKEIKEKQGNSLTIRISSDKVYDSMMNELFNNGAIFDMFEYNESIGIEKDKKLLILKINW